MVTTPNISYQPAVAYQGGVVGSSEQEPKSGQIQPRKAPVADTQHAALDSDSARRDRGRNLDMLV